MLGISAVIGVILACLSFWSMWQLVQRRVLNLDLDNIPGPPSVSFWAGNLEQFFHPRGWDFHRIVTQDYEGIVKLYGPFGRRMLYVFDPSALHTMILKEHAIFEEGSTFLNTNILVFGPGLIATSGDQHRKQRKILNPAFSANHLRKIFPVFHATTTRLQRALMIRLKDGPCEIDLFHWMSRAALELVAQGGFGHSFDNLVEDTESEYGEALRFLFPTLAKFFLLRPFLPLILRMGPAHFRRRVLELLPFPSVQKLRTLVDTMERSSRQIVKAKLAALRQSDVEDHKDVMSVMIDANMKAGVGDQLSEEEIVAQVATLIMAATDTTASTVCRVCQMLAQDMRLQERVRKEVTQVYDGGNPSYDAIIKLPNLDAIIRETLRLWPPATLLTREARRDTVLPLSKPIRGVDGNWISQIPISKGTEVFVGILGANTNKAMWGDDALEWKPERWLSDLPHTVTDISMPGIYTNQMTFLGGQRSCIGFKFGELSIKVSLAMLLSNFTFEKTEHDISWNIATVNYPTVGSERLVSAMPINMELLR